MPLIKSAKKSAVSKNIKTEMESGKPQKQSIAIALSTQRAAKKHKMALGGAVEGPTHSKPYDRDPGTPAPKPNDKKIPESEFMSENWSEGSAPPMKPDNKRPPEAEYMAGHFAEGGAIDHAKMAKHHTEMARHYMRGGDIETADQHYTMADKHRQATAPATAISPHEDKQESGYSDDEMAGKFADGGMAKQKEPKSEGDDYQVGEKGSPGQKFTKYVQDMFGGTKDEQPKKKAEGGMMGSDGPKSIAATIMARKKYANGGEVDLAQNAEEHDNEADDLNYDALRKENYSESDGLEDLTSPMDSNEHADEIPEDQHDMVSKLRARMKSRRGF